MTKEQRVWLAQKGTEKSLRLAEVDGWEVHEVAKAPRPNSPEDIRQSMDLLQKIHGDSQSSNERCSCGMCQDCELLRGERLDVIDAAILANPGTNYTYRPQTADEERTRRQRYARMIALETLRLLDKKSAVETSATPSPDARGDAALWVLAWLTMKGGLGHDVHGVIEAVMEGRATMRPNNRLHIEPKSAEETSMQPPAYYRIQDKHDRHRFYDYDSRLWDLVIPSAVTSPPDLPTAAAPAGLSGKATGKVGMHPQCREPNNCQADQNGYCAGCHAATYP